MARLTRSQFVRGAAAAAIGLSLPVRAEGAAAMEKRPIPSSGALLPVVGLGTWRGFDVGPSAADRAPLVDVLDALFASGGTVIDTSPMYGEAERVLGDLLGAKRSSSFLATKVWTTGKQAGIDQMRRSLTLMKTTGVELMQIHNLLDWKTHLPELRVWKATNKARYVGVTHYTPQAHDELCAVLEKERFDFVQINYAVDDRNAEK